MFCSARVVQSPCIAVRAPAPVRAFPKNAAYIIANNFSKTVCVSKTVRTASIPKRPRLFLVVNRSKVVRFFQCFPPLNPRLHRSFSSLLPYQQICLLHQPKQVEAAAGGDVSDHYYYDWRGTQDIAEYCERVPGGEFTASTYCEEALMDRHGSQQLIRWEGV